MPSLLQSIAVLTIVAYLAQCGIYYHRRNQRSWAAITGQIRTGNTSLALLINARVVMEMADYAERSGYSDADRLSLLRKDAMQIRVETLVSFTTRHF